MKGEGSAMKWNKALLAAATALAAASGAQAAGVGVRAGTTGLGADVGFSLVPTLSARLGYSGLSYSRTVDVTDVEYDGRLRLSNLNLLLDFSPLPGPVRITGGLIFNDNKVDVTGRPTGGTFTLNGNVYPAAAIGSLSGTVKSGNSAAPYLGIGYGNVAGLGVNFYFDLGVMFQGTPSASLAATCGAAVPASVCSQVQRDVAAEQARLQDQISGFKYYPVANIGVTIGF
jgi:hypothetical protein